MKKGQKKYLLPSDLVPEDAKLQNGDEMNPHMVGAYFGSSLELNITATLQKSNAGCLVCPAYDDLQNSVKPKKQKGEFGALKSETQSVAQYQLGKTLFEIKTVDEAIACSKVIDELKGLNSEWYGNLKFETTDGMIFNATQALMIREQHKSINQKIQKEKDSLIEEAGCKPQKLNGRWVNPEYPQDLLDKLAERNSHMFSVTGVNLLIRFSGQHTIAKNGAFYKSSVNSAELDRMFEMFDYKESNSFVKGKIKYGQISMPIQTLDQLKQITKTLTDRKVVCKNFPASVLESAIKLVPDR